jgi:hypothetical protein
MFLMSITQSYFTYNIFEFFVIDLPSVDDSVVDKWLVMPNTLAYAGNVKYAILFHP